MGNDLCPMSTDSRALLCWGLGLSMPVFFTICGIVACISKCGFDCVEWPNGPCCWQYKPDCSKCCCCPDPVDPISMVELGANANVHANATTSTSTPTLTPTPTQTLPYPSPHVSIRINN